MASHSSIAIAQNAPTGGGGNGGGDMGNPPPPDANGGPGGNNNGGPGGDNNGPPQMGNQNGNDSNNMHGGPGGHMGGNRGGGPGGGLPQDIVRFQSFLAIVDQYAKLAEKPDAAGVSAVVSAADLLKKRGPQATIDFFTKQLTTVKSDAVKRAIHLQLIDLYRAANQPEKALAEATLLMNAEPTTQSSGAE